METVRAARYALALLALTSGAAAADGATDSAYGYCESAEAGNGYVYITPVFPDPPRHAETGFERYLARNYGYDGGPVRCFSLESKQTADGFRNQRIELFHWRHEDRILATRWTPEARGQTPAGSSTS